MATFNDSGKYRRIYRALKAGYTHEDIHILEGVSYSNINRIEQGLQVDFDDRPHKITVSLTHEELQYIVYRLICQQERTNARNYQKIGDFILDAALSRISNRENKLPKIPEKYLDRVREIVGPVPTKESKADKQIERKAKREERLINNARRLGINRQEMEEIVEIYGLLNKK